MGNTLGYATGALSGLALLAALSYGREHPKGLHDLVYDATSTFTREVQKMDLGNTFEVLGDATHDLMQRNPKEAQQQFQRWNAGIDNTPYQDHQLHAARYRNAHDLVEQLKDESTEPWALSQYMPFGLDTKGELALGLAGLGLGALVAGALGRKRT